MDRGLVSEGCIHALMARQIGIPTDWWFDTFIQYSENSEPIKTLIVRITRIYNTFKFTYSTWENRIEIGHSHAHHFYLFMRLSDYKAIELETWHPFWKGIHPNSQFHLHTHVWWIHVY